MRSSKRYVRINWNFICTCSSLVVVNKFTVTNAKNHVIEKIMTKIILMTQGAAMQALQHKIFYI